jgi:hypothetical protein
MNSTVSSADELADQMLDPESVAPFDYYYFASMLSVITCFGYLIADLNRGFLEVELALGNYLFVVLGWLTLLQACWFYQSWKQLCDDYDAVWYPFQAAEVCNIVASVCFACTSICYVFEGDDSPSGTLVADAVLCVECVANVVFLVSSVLYFRAWCIETVIFEAVECDAAMLTLQAGDMQTQLLSHASDSYVRTSDDDMKLPPYAMALGNEDACSCDFVCRPDRCAMPEMHEQIWNVVPSVLYVLASILSLVAHFTAYSGAIFGPQYVNQSVTQTIYVYDKFVHVPSGECFTNMWYSPDRYPPPCNNPYLFNTSCRFHGVDCWSCDLHPSGECASPDIARHCSSRNEWPDGARDKKQVPLPDGSTQTCNRVYPYTDLPCNNTALWDHAVHVEGRHCVVSKVLANEYREAPCNNPFLPDFIQKHPTNVTIDVVNTTIVEIVPPRPTVGQLLALKLASRYYIYADFLYCVDAMLIVWGWMRFDQWRREQALK